MKPVSWACFRCIAALLLLALCAGALSQPLRPRNADVVFSADLAPPAATAAWQRVDLPFSFDRPGAWFRVAFEAPQSPADAAWAVYLPYFYTGGRLFLNGAPLAHIQEPTADVIVRWERPQLVPIAPALLRPGTNELLVRIAATPVSRGRMPLPAIGPHVQLLPEYDARLFWIRTMSQFTVISCVIVGLLALFIWWRRPEESLYGLFGAAALLWGVRTLTLVIEVMPTPAWYAWRTVYHAATGGFTIVMLLFAMSLAGMRYPRLKWALLAYWLLGPAGYLASKGDEVLIGRFWAGGLLPIGVAVLAIGAVAAWRQRTAALTVLSLALALAVLAGFHDYLVATSSPVILAIAPQAAAHRVFLLHYAADILLLVMGGILAARLVGSLQAIEQLNRTLESRVTERETALADNYERLRKLEREHAIVEERQQIMRDLHDGLGSQLFLTLSRAEVGRIDQDEIVQALRECIADMRLTLEAMGPQSSDFLQAWSDFRYRWQQLLENSGLSCSWEVDAQDRQIELTPHVILQLLRIVQEALTNVLKHARAEKVAIRLRTDDEWIGIEVFDDGRGLRNTDSHTGRGIANMRARAQRVGAHIEITDQHPGVRVAVDFNRQNAVVA
ncbi:MAG TPA: ATP-binding protein [Ramlibacter sp.]|nr:ATP-binding protein [Ramlibacter sp.]